MFYYQATRTYDINQMALKFAILEISYIIRFAIMIVMSVVLIINISGIYLDKYGNYISTWAKNYKLTYIEQIEIDKANLDDV